MEVDVHRFTVETIVLAVENVVHVVVTVHDVTFGTYSVVNVIQCVLPSVG